jgi:hypothetical protein
MVSIKLVKVNVARLPGAELTPVLVALDGRIAMVDSHVVGDRVVPPVYLAAYGAHESVRNALDVLFVAAPAYVEKIFVK